MKNLALVVGLFLVAGVVAAKENPVPVERVGVCNSVLLRRYSTKEWSQTT